MRQASLLWQGTTGGWLVLAFAGVCLMGAAPAFAQAVPAVMDGLAAGLCAGGE